MDGYYQCCNHCYKGIKYGEDYKQCILCEKEFCKQCVDVAHPSDHSDGTYDCTSRALNVNNPSAPRACVICQTMVHTYIECDEEDCNFLFCAGCWVESMKQGLKHEHNSVTGIEMPHCTSKPSCADGCSLCLRCEAYTHCTRCQVGIPETARYYECKDCLRVFDDAGAIFCESCYKVVSSEEANKNHTFLSIQFKIQHDAEDEQSLSMRCTDCDKVYTNWNTQTLGRHAHNKWQKLMGPAKAEAFRSETMRGCTRRTVKQNDVPTEELHAGGAGCHICWTGFRKDATVLFCGLCGFQACSNCEDTGKVHHRHSMFHLRLAARRSVDPQFWRVLEQHPTGDWTCDNPGCGEKFWSKIASYVVCSGCDNYGFCNDCFSDNKIKKEMCEHACTAGIGSLDKVSFVYKDMNDIPEGYLERQTELALEERTRLIKLEEEERLRKEAASKARDAQHKVQRRPVASPTASQTYSTQPVAAKPQVQRPAASVQRTQLPRRPAPQPRQQGRQSSQTGQLLKAVGKGIFQGLIQANNAANNNNNAAFGGGSTGISPMDFSSANMAFQANMQQNMWDSVNAAANWNVQ